MHQVIRRGIREIIVDEVPDPAPPPHHVVVRPEYSLISAGMETASIHYHDEMLDFVAPIREGRQPSAGLEAGVRAAVGCVGILDAAERGTSLALDWVGLLDATTA